MLFPMYYWLPVRSSRLYRRLVMEKKLFTEIDSSITGDIEPGLFLLKGKLSPGISLEQGEEAVKWNCDE